jgi:hypothetical protein
MNHLQSDSMPICCPAPLLQGVADLVRKGGLLCSERPAGLLRKGSFFTPKYAQIFKITLNVEGKEIIYSLDINDSLLDLSSRFSKEKYIRPKEIDKARIQLAEMVKAIYSNNASIPKIPNKSLQEVKPESKSDSAKSET